MLAAIMTGMFLTDPPLNAEVRAMYDRDLAEDGYISNNTRLWGWRPDVFTAFKQTRVTNGTTMTLSDREFALVISATVAQRSDSYCSLAWGTNLAKESTEAVAAAVLAGGTPTALSEREAALVQWARLVAGDANATSAGDVDRLRDVGFSDRDIFEATALIAFRIAFTTVDSALGARPDQQLARTAPPGVRDAVRYGRPVDPNPSAQEASEGPSD